MTLINKDNVLDLLQRAVNEKGADYTAPYCRYFNEDGSPSCIVGHVFSYVLIDEDQRRLDIQEMWNGLVVGKVDNQIPNLMDSEALGILARAQRAQDRLEQWGDALDWARRA